MTSAIKTKVSSRLALYTEARCFEVMGLTDEAEGLYRLALSRNSDDFILLSQAADFFRHGDEPEKAVPFLEALIKLAGNAPAESIVQGRRHLALSLATDRAGNAAIAKALLDGNLQIQPNNPADLRARAYLQVVSPAQRAQAVRIFEETARRQPLAPEEQLELAQLHDAAGDISLASEQISGLLAAEPENAQFLAFSIRHLIKTGELESALGQLRTLQSLEPERARTKELQRQLLKS